LQKVQFLAYFGTNNWQFLWNNF